MSKPDLFHSIPITFARNGNGILLVTEWGGNEQEFSQLLDQVGFPDITFDGDLLTIHATNGTRTYKKMYQISERLSTHYRATGPVKDAV
jgi:hypothetical protein